LGVVAHTCRRLRQDGEFETRQGYAVSSRPAWATRRNPESKKKNKSALTKKNVDLYTMTLEMVDMLIKKLGRINC
jgi:hypothetical protein